jgi:hypothetical protein
VVLTFPHDVAFFQNFIDALIDAPPPKSSRRQAQNFDQNFSKSSNHSAQPYKVETTQTFFCA